jgi:hypothetical protein
MITLMQTFLAAASDHEVIKLDHQLIRIGQLQSAIFILQLFVFGFQAWMLRKTVKAAGDQSIEMRRSVDEAKRAANAMEKFAESATVASKAATESVATTRDTMTRLLRAYVCVNFGEAVFQNTLTKYRFEARVLLINAGQTPAYKVAFKVRADILPFPLSQDFDFAVLDNPASSESTLGGHAPPVTLTGVVDRLCSDQEIIEIRSRSKCLYLFGTVTYEDVYGVKRYANFCFNVIWQNDGKSMGLLTKRHNDSD